LFPDWEPDWETIRRTSLKKNTRPSSHRGAAAGPSRCEYLQPGLCLSPDELCALS
jgi:hypothetical protein